MSSRPVARPHPGPLPEVEGIIALVLSAALAWTAQFHHFRDLGLYEDDYFFISEAMGKDPSYLAARFITAFTRLPQGRPFGFFLPDLFSFVGDKLGGLPAIYLLGFAIITLNTVLCYWLLRSRAPVAPATLGAAVFCLFPADTTKILLTHDFQLQPSLTFALVASLLYVRNHRVLPYVVGAGALLTYENGFLPLFALPLLSRPWDRRTLVELVRHCVLLGVVVVAVVALRFLVGEGRATGSIGGLAAIVPPLLASLVLGPFRAAAGMFYGPIRALPEWNVENTLAALLMFCVFAVLLWIARREIAGASRLAGLQIVAAGGVMLVCAYGLAFTHFPPTALIGRGTSVHLGATLGMAVLATGVSWLMLSAYSRIAVALLAGYVALAVGYYVTIERDFVRSWQLQRSFWQQVVACCSDFADGTVLLYALSPSDETTFIFTNSWADPLVLGETFSFPSDWSNPPRLFSLTEWQDRVAYDENGGLRWWVPGASWDEHWEPLPQGDVVLLSRSADGALSREAGSVGVAGGHELRLKAPEPLGSWPPAQLYEPLLG